MPLSCANFLGVISGKLGAKGVGVFLDREIVTDSSRIAAPLNPAYKQSEFEFYIQDLQSCLILIPKGAYGRVSHAIRAARTFHVAIAECYWDGQDVVLDLKDRGQLDQRKPVQAQTAKPDDVA